MSRITSQVSNTVNGAFMSVALSPLPAGFALAGFSAIAAGPTVGTREKLRRFAANLGECRHQSRSYTRL